MFILKAKENKEELLGYAILNIFFLSECQIKIFRN